MQKKYLYEYAVIRVLPKVEREEFINVGVILFSKEARYIKTLYRLDEDRLNCFPSELSYSALENGLRAFDKISSGLKDGGAIARLELAERFRWLTAVRSTCIQTSRPHSGFTTDLEHTLQSLFEELVL